MRTHLQVAAVTVAIVTSAPAARAALTPARVAFWTRVAQCETGGRWDWGAGHRPNEGSSYEGGVGFAASTWRLWAGALGLVSRFPHAYDAPPMVQMRVAEYGLDRGGYWGCLQ